MYITSEFIKIKVRCEDWKDAVRKGVKILEEKEFVDSSYKDAIFKNFEEFGAYMVIAPKIALLHARPEDGAIKTGVSVMLLEHPVCFGHELNDPVKLVFTLSSKDKFDHIKILENIMKILMDEDSLDKLINAHNLEEIIEILNKNQYF